MTLGLPLEYQKFPEFFDTEDNETTLENWNQYNLVFDNLLKPYSCKTILDLTCGTGSQVFHFTKLGYKVVGSDFSPQLLKIARKRAHKQNLNIAFIDGDMRTSKLGKFDACITMFNAIGHVSRDDFKKTIKNIFNNLNDGGVYMFDIFNINALTNDVIRTFPYQNHKQTDNVTFLKSQVSFVDRDRSLLISYDTYTVQKACGKPEILQNEFALQIYTSEELKSMLIECGFKNVRHFALDGSEFITNKSVSILTIAEK